MTIERHAWLRRRARALGLLALVGLVTTPVFFWPCFVYRSGDVITHTAMELRQIFSAIDQYHTDKGVYPTGRGRALFAELVAANTWDAEVPTGVALYSKQRLSLADVIRKTSVSHHGRFIFQPFEPIPAPRPYRWSTKPLAELAATRGSDPVILCVDIGSYVQILTLRGNTLLRPVGDPESLAALDATSEDEGPEK